MSADPFIVLKKVANFDTSQPIAPVHQRFKRMADVGLSIAALIVLFPVLILIVLGVKLTSKGPVIFKQKRVGLNGDVFNFYKFRSMVANAEDLKSRLANKNEVSGPVFKMKHDPRVTKFGQFMRKHSIDEIPQLINVIRGEMSIVGPRPPVPAEVEKYESWQLRRLSVKPGLTCIWQVSGRSQISFDKWVRMDLQYIDNWSFWLDVKLIAATFSIVFTGRGAY